MTLDTGDRILYFQPDLTLEAFPTETGSGTEEDPIALIAGFASINLTTMEYKLVTKLQLNSITNKEANENAYLYAFYDPRVEDILSISFSYEYRIINVFGLWKIPWETEYRVYTHGEISEVDPPLWIGMVFGLVYPILDATNYYNVESIQSITKEEISDNVMDSYRDDLGGSLSDLDTLNLYKIYLGNFDAAIETGYDIQDVVIMNILYVYNGIVYEASTEVIDQVNITPDLLTGIDWTSIVNWILNNGSMIVGIIAGIIALILLAKVFTAVSVLLTILGQLVKGLFVVLGYVFKGIGYGIYYIVKGIGYTLYFIVYLVPKGLYQTAIFLVVPAEKRKQRARKEQAIYVSRSI